MDELKAMEMIIYKITNTINGKVYIGQTRHAFNCRYGGKGCEGVYRVYNTHLKAKNDGKSYNKHLLRSMEKYGVDNFTVEIIEQCKTLAKLDSREKYWIRFYKSYDPDYGYNVQLGGNTARLSNKRKKQRKQERIIEEANKYSFVYEIIGNEIVNIEIDILLLKTMSINERFLYILFSLLQYYGVNSITIKQLKTCFNKGNRDLYILLDSLNKMDGIKCSINNEVIYYEIKNSGSDVIELHVQYSLDLIASMQQYTRMLNKETVLVKCKRCGRLECVEKSASNTKYCKRCKDEVKREQSRESKRRKRNKN